MAKYREVKETKNSSHNLTEILPAAEFGRVDTLFITQNHKHSEWGQFDPSSGKVQTCQEQSFKCSDLVNLTTIKTLQTGGSVYVLKPDEMPQKTNVAAIFRYAV